jgi:DNA-binding response OmpR family regulator
MITHHSNSILILEEEKTADVVLHHLSLCLETEGFEVFQSYNQNEAYRICQSRHPVVAIVDLFTPEIEGTFFLKRLRSNSRLKNTRVILLTDRSMLGYEMGADDYVTRPFSPKEILMRVKQYLAHDLNSFSGISKRKGTEKICKFKDDSVSCA